MLHLSISGLFPQMAASFIFTSTIWWIWTSWRWRPKCPFLRISARPSAQGVFVCMFAHLHRSAKCLRGFSFSGICWNQTLCSAVCTPVTTEEKPPTRPTATSLIKSGENIKDGYKPETQASTPHLFNLLWYNFCFVFSSIVCFSDYVEELGHPYMWVQNLGGLQFPVGASEVGVNPCCHPIGAQIVTVTGVMLARSCSFPECWQWQLPECQPDGENHEAAQATTAVPLSFTQTVCLPGYVRCTINIFNNLWRYLDLIVLVSSEHSIIPVTSECLYLFPAKIMSRLARWVAITYEEYRVCVLLYACLRAALQSMSVKLRSSLFLSL